MAKFTLTDGESILAQFDSVIDAILFQADCEDDRADSAEVDLDLVDAILIMENN